MTAFNLAASWDGETRSVTSEHPWIDRAEVRDICCSQTINVHPGKTMIYTFRDSLSSPKLAGHIFKSPSGEHFVSSDVIQLQLKLPNSPKEQRNSIKSLEHLNTILTGPLHQGDHSTTVAGNQVQAKTIGGRNPTDESRARPVRLPPAPPPPRSTSLQTKESDPEFVPQLLRHTLLEDSPPGKAGTNENEPDTIKEEWPKKGESLIVSQRVDDQSQSSFDSDVSSDDVSMTFPVTKSGTRFFTAKECDGEVSKRLSKKLSEPLPGDEEGEEMYKTKRGHNPLKRFFARKKGRYDPSADLQFGHSVLPTSDSGLQDAKKKKKSSPKIDKKKSHAQIKDKESKKPEMQKSKLTKDSIVVIISSGKCLTDISFDLTSAELETRNGDSVKLKDSNEDVNVADVNEVHDTDGSDNNNLDKDTRHKSSTEDDSDQNEIYANFPTVQRRKTAGVVMKEPAKLSTFFAPEIQSSTGDDQEEANEEKSSSSSSDEDEKRCAAYDDTHDSEEIYVNSMFIPKLNQTVIKEPARKTSTSESSSSDKKTDTRSACYVVNPEPEFHEKIIASDEKIKVSSKVSDAVIKQGDEESKQPNGDVIESRYNYSKIVSGAYAQVDKADTKEQSFDSKNFAANHEVFNSPDINQSMKRFGTMENLAPDSLNSDMSSNDQGKVETNFSILPEDSSCNLKSFIPTPFHNSCINGKETDENNQRVSIEIIPTSSIEHIERFLGLDGEEKIHKSSVKLKPQTPHGTITSPNVPSKIHDEHVQGQNKIMDTNLLVHAGVRDKNDKQNTVEPERLKVEKENSSLQANDSTRNVGASDDNIHVSHAEIRDIVATKSVVRAPEKSQPKGIYSIIKSKTNPPAVTTSMPSSMNKTNDYSKSSNVNIGASHATASIQEKPKTIMTKPFSVNPTSVSMTPNPPCAPTSASINLVQPHNTPTSQPIPSPDHSIQEIGTQNNKPLRPPPTKPKPPSWKMKTILRKFESPESYSPSTSKKPDAHLTDRGSEENINKDLIACVLKELDDYIDKDVTENKSVLDVTENDFSPHTRDRSSEVYERFIKHFPDSPDIAETDVNKTSGEVLIRGGDVEPKTRDPENTQKCNGSLVYPRVDSAKYEEVVDWDHSIITSEKVLLSLHEKTSNSSQNDKEKETLSLNLKMADKSYDEVVDKISEEKNEKIYDEIGEAKGSDSPTSKCFKFNWKKRDAVVSETSKTKKIKTGDENKESGKKKVKVRKVETNKNGPEDIDTHGKLRDKSAKIEGKGRKQGVKVRSLSSSSSHCRDGASESSSQNSGSSSSQMSSEDSEYEVVGKPKITNLKADTDIMNVQLNGNIADTHVEHSKEEVHGADSYGYEIPAKYSIKRNDPENGNLSLKNYLSCGVGLKANTNTKSPGTLDIDESKNDLQDLAKNKSGIKNSSSPDPGVKSEDRESSLVKDSKEKLIADKVQSVKPSDAQINESNWSSPNLEKNLLSVRVEPNLSSSSLEEGFTVREPDLEFQENTQKLSSSVGIELSSPTINPIPANDHMVKPLKQSESVPGFIVAQARKEKQKKEISKPEHSSSSDSTSTSGDSDSERKKKSKKNHNKKDKIKTIQSVHLAEKFDVPIKEKLIKPKDKIQDAIIPDKDNASKIKSTTGVKLKENSGFTSSVSLNEIQVSQTNLAAKERIENKVDVKLNFYKTDNNKAIIQEPTQEDLHSTDMKVGQLAGLDVSQNLTQKYQSQSVQAEQNFMHLEGTKIMNGENKNKILAFPNDEILEDAQNLDEDTHRSDAELSVLEIPDVQSMSELDEDPWKDYSALELGKNTRDLTPKQLPRLTGDVIKEAVDGLLVKVPNKTSHVLPDTADRSRSLPPDHAAPPVPRIRSSLQITNETVDPTDLSTVKVSSKHNIISCATPGNNIEPDFEIYSDGTSDPGTKVVEGHKEKNWKAVVLNSGGDHLKIESETRDRQYDQLPVRMRKSGNTTTTFDPIVSSTLLSFESPHPPTTDTKGKKPVEKSDYAEPWEEKKFEELSPLPPAFINSRSSSEYSGNSSNQARMSLTSEDLHPTSVIDFKVGAMNRSTSLDQVPGGKPSRRKKSPDDGKKGKSFSSSLTSLFHRKKKDNKASMNDNSYNENDMNSGYNDSDDDGTPEKTKKKKEKRKESKQAVEKSKKPEKGKSDKNKPDKDKRSTKSDKGHRSSLIDQPEDLEMVLEGRPLCRLIRVNEDGSRDVELTRPQSEPLGIFFSKGRETKKDGLVVKSFLDKHAKRLFAGILRVGDEIIEIDEADICPLTLDEVKDIIQQKERMVIKLCPLEGGERSMNLTSSGPL